MEISRVSLGMIFFFAVLAVAILSAAAVLGLAEDPYIFGGEEAERPDGFDGSTQEHYVNPYVPGEEPDWIPEDELDKGNHEAVNMYEVTRYPDSDPQPEHYDAAWEVYRESYEAAKQQGYFDFEAAKEDDYVPVDDLHYLKKDYYLDDDNLNPENPEVLVYFGGDDHKILAGYMYHMDGLLVEGPQFAGPLTLWHYHTYGGGYSYCFESVLNTGDSFEDVGCPEDAVKEPRGGEMIHVWFVEHPEGPFATDMGYNLNRTKAVEAAEEAGGAPDKMNEEEFREWTEESYREFRQE